MLPCGTDTTSLSQYFFFIYKFFNVVMFLSKGRGGEVDR